MHSKVELQMRVVFGVSDFVPPFDLREMLVIARGL